MSGLASGCTPDKPLIAIRSNGWTTRRMILGYKYRVNPNFAQARAMSDMLADFCSLYNAALQQRAEAYRRGKLSVTYNMQAGELKAVRQEIPELARWSFTGEQQVLRKLEKTYRRFFDRSRKGLHGGYPRFKAADRYHAALFRIGDGVAFRENGRISIKGIPGNIKVRWHRTLPSKPASCFLSRNAGKWYIIFNVEIEPDVRTNQESVGIDIGLTNLIALSTGEIVKRPNFTKASAKKLRRLRRAMARCKRNSKIYNKRKSAVVTLHAHIAASRRDFLHKQSRKIVSKFGRIAVENLNVEAMTVGDFTTHIRDAAWGTFISMLRYKAEKAGREFIEVDPRGTSKTCPECGTVAKKTLFQRTHNCGCGCVLDRDVAAAKVIHFRAFGFRPGMGLESLNQQSAAV